MHALQPCSVVTWLQMRCPRKMREGPHGQTDPVLVCQMAVAGLMPPLEEQVNEAQPPCHSSRRTCLGTFRRVCRSQHQGSRTSMKVALSSTSAGDHGSDLIKARSTFWVSVARVSLARELSGLTVPRKMDLNWFMPAFAKSRVGSSRGTTVLDGTTSCCLLLKKSRKAARTLSPADELNTIFTVSGHAAARCKAEGGGPLVLIERVRER